MGRSSDSTKLSNKKSIDATSSADVDKHSEKMSSSKDVSKEEKRPRKNLFDRLFSQDSMDSGEYSDERDDACSVGSETYYESDSDSDSDEDETEGPSAASSLLRFDRDMRARHRNACKNMTNGKYAKAIKTFEHILSDMLDRFGEEHHRVGAALHNVAVANLRAGLLDDAKDAIEEAIRIRKQTLGHEHPKVAVSSICSCVLVYICLFACLLCVLMLLWIFALESDTLTLTSTFSTRIGRWLKIGLSGWVRNYPPFHEEIWWGNQSFQKCDKTPRNRGRSGR